MKRTSGISVRSRSGTFPSPRTPNYCHGSGTTGHHKGWSSERVPPPGNSSRRHGSSSALLTFRNGKTMPSKWEDAEKWIFNPISGDAGIGSPSALLPHHQRPKSKSGPLGAPASIRSSYSSTSPLAIRNSKTTSPFLTGVLVTDHGCCESARSGRDKGGSEVLGGLRAGGRRSYSAHADQTMMQSSSVHAWSDMLIESSSSFPSSEDEIGAINYSDEKFESTKDAATMISPFSMRKDVGTQMSSDGSTPCSPKERLHFSPSPSSSPVIEGLQRHFSKLEVRDVQVDDLVTVSRWSKVHATHGSDKEATNSVEWKKKVLEPRASAWVVEDTTKCMTKLKREEAKITAWENLQKAKAEAAIRKLEVKLEKKRSSSMDKIMNKLRLAQKKAQDMRNEVATGEVDQAGGGVRKSPSFCMAGQMASLSGCFTCHAF